jgi:hypothetical protein
LASFDEKSYAHPVPFILDMRTNIIRFAFIQGRQVELNNKQMQLAEKYEKKYGIK